ncbi:Small glutamine-rich tetratricopeptide repeat-containing protein [Sesamum alatum]|uniref:Small glutamine-rich tetratricopeptide repeat-containing protein n=1 Tax=Sesamum alatum TaxID=300844 RepID=A0AAE1YGK3_9LAMI|nr:Small glutamine-rich tetratricopeptide repeat-containing protein [Sesamum alatum]
MANLTTDSPLSRRIARSFLQFLNSVEPSAGVDSEALDVAKECLAEVFKIDQSSLHSQPNCDSLIDIFSSREAIARQAVDSERSFGAPTSSSGKNAEGEDKTREPHSPGKDELFGQFFGALEKIHYFRRMPDGNDDQIQLDRATYLFHKAVEEMQIAGCQTFDQKILAETFKSQGNKAMQSKLYTEAIELYTFAIALCEDNAVYYCNRAAAYTQIHRYAEAVQDCLKSIEINPNYSKAYSRLGFAYYAQGKYRDAIDKGFKKALQLDPNNDSVKENIRVAEQKLKEEQQRAGPGQSSTSNSHEQSSHQHGGGSRSNAAGTPPFTSMPFNINGLPADITSMLMNMAGNAFPGPHSQNGHEGENEAGTPNEPGIRVGGNINVNVNELPEDLSGALRSMMGMFSGAASHGNQQDDSNGRSSAS